MPTPKHRNTRRVISRTVSRLSGRQTLPALRQEISETRRGSVYRTDPELFTPERRARREITPSVVAEVRRLREVEGWSQLKVASELELEQHQVSKICREYNIGKKS